MVGMKLRITVLVASGAAVPAGVVVALVHLPSTTVLVSWISSVILNFSMENLWLLAQVCYTSRIPANAPERRYGIKQILSNVKIFTNLHIL